MVTPPRRSRRGFPPGQPPGSAGICLGRGGALAVEQFISLQPQSLDEAGMHDTLDGNGVGRMFGEHLQRVQILSLTPSYAQHAGEFEEIEIVLSDEIEEAFVWKCPAPNSLRNGWAKIASQIGCAVS